MSAISPAAIWSVISLILSAYFVARRADLAEADAAVLDGGDHVGAALEAAVLGALDRVEHRDVDLLQRRGQDVVAEVGLVGVDADALDALLLGRVKRAEAALAGHLEDDLGALRDLVERDLLALRLVDEVLRVAVQRLDAGVGVRGALLEARDVVVHRRDLLAADRGHGGRVVVLRPEAREVTGEVAGLLLLEEQALDVLRLALQARGREVDDREVVVRELAGDRGGRLAHEEADRDAQVVLLLGERRQVRDVVAVRLGDQHATLDAEVGLGVLEALVGEEVEGTVVEAADVRDDAGLDGLGFRGLIAAAATTSVVIVVAAGGDSKCERSNEREKEEAEGLRHGRVSSLGQGLGDPTPFPLTAV